MEAREPMSRNPITPRKWTTEEDERLRSFGRMPKPEAAKLLNRSEAAIQQRRCLLGLTDPNHNDASAPTPEQIAERCQEVRMIRAAKERLRAGGIDPDDHDPLWEQFNEYERRNGSLV